MFGKLIKHEIAELWKSLRAVWGLSLLIFFTSAGFLLLRNGILSNISIFTAILGLLALSLGPVIIIVMRYYRSMAGQEAYFTHTIPSKTSTIVWAKFLASYLMELISLLALLPLIYLFIRLTLAADMQAMPITVAFVVAGDLLAEGLGQGLPGWVLPVFFLLLLAQVFSQLVAWFYSVAKGSEAAFHKFGAGGPVIVYVIIYFIQQALSLLAMLFVPLGLRVTNISGQIPKIEVVAESTRWVFSKMLDPELQTASVIGIGMLPVLLLFSCLLFWLMLRSHTKHTSVR